MRIALALLLALAACGGGDGGSADGNGGEPAEETEAFNFDEHNAREAAAICVRASELFPLVGELVAGMVEAVLASGVQSGGSVDLGDIGLCDSGRTTLVWDDEDSDGAISAGDSLTLTLAGCGDGTSVRNGSLRLVYDAGTATDAEGRVTVAITTDRSGDLRVAHGGSFRLGYETPDSVAWSFFFGGPSDLDALLTCRRGDGQTAVESLPVDFLLGCLAVEVVAWSPAVPERFRLTLAGVAKSTRHGVLTLNTTVRLDFEPLLGDSLPDSGTVGFASLGQCASVGYPDGVEDSDASTLRLGAGGNGVLRLDGMDGWGLSFTLDATWQDLR